MGGHYSAFRRLTIKDAALNLAGFLEVLVVVRFIETEKKDRVLGTGRSILGKIRVPTFRKWEILEVDDGGRCTTLGMGLYHWRVLLGLGSMGRRFPRPFCV